MNILICGGRDFEDWGLFIDTMNELSDRFDFDGNQPITIIQGGATGADFCAKLYANYCDWDYREFPALWKTHGKAAGPIRNKLMLTEGRPDLVVAFPGRSGTMNMIKQAREAGVEVIIIASRS